MNPIAVCIIIAFAIPSLIGSLALLASGRFPHPLVSVAAGTLVIWAVAEVCLVPLVYIGASFRGSILVVWTAVALVTVLLALTAGHRYLRKIKTERRERRRAANADHSTREASSRKGESRPVLPPGGGEKVSAEGKIPAAGENISAEGKAHAAGEKVSAEGKAPAAGEKVSAEGKAPAAGENISAAGNAHAGQPGKAEPASRRLPDRISDLIFLIPLLLVLIMVLRGTSLYQHTDDDDTRFVVNAVDMVRTDTLLRTSPATGRPLSRPVWELKKDAVAPWAFYIAMLAEMTGLKASAIAHTYLPPLLMVLISCALFALGRILFGRERWKIYAFVTVCWLVNLFGYYSIYSAEAFVMGRLWQGKAVLAGFGIPVLLAVFFSIYAQPDRRDNYYWLAAAVLALDLLSSQSIILTSAAAAFFALAYAIALRKPLLLFKMGVACIPNLILLAVYALS